MKKLLMVAITLMVGFCAAMAQKDVKAVGVNLNYGSEISNFGIGAKFQYGITDQVRVEPSFDYYLKKDGMSFWDINANVHYLFNATESIKIYPLVGLGYGHYSLSWEYDYDDFYGNEELMSEGKIALNLGAGAEYQLDKNLSIGAELKYQIINHFNQLVITIGATYKF